MESRRPSLHIDYVWTCSVPAQGIGGVLAGGELIEDVRQRVGGVGHQVSQDLELGELAALTVPEHTPWAAAPRVLPHDVSYRWCQSSVCREGHHPCLRGVQPEEVVAALELLAPARREDAP